MSETGSTRFPEPPRLPASLQAGNSKDNSRSSLLITAIRDENGQTIRNTGDKPIRIEGEIQKSAETGIIRIKTERGMVDIEVAQQDGNSKTPPLRPGMKIEVDIPPERQRPQNTNEIQAQIRVREAAPKQQKAPEEIVTKTPATNIPYAPRPDIYTPPAKAPETLSPQDIARNLIGVAVRMDPVSPEQLKAVQAQILNTPPPAILPAQLTAQIQAMAQSLPLQISTEQMALLIQASATGVIKTDPAIETPRSINDFLILNQLDSANLSINTSTSSSNISVTEPAILPPSLTQNTQLKETISTFTQPFDIKSNFQFLSPETIKISAGSLAPIPLTSTELAPSIQTMQAPVAEKTTLIQGPVTAIFQGITLPEVLLSTPPFTAEENITMPPPAKADIFAQFGAILQESEIGQLSLTIQGTSVHNLPIVALSTLSTDDNFYTQNFILQAPLGAFPAGSVIELSPLQPLTPQGAQGVQQAAMMHNLPLVPLMPPSPQSWPVLDEIVQTLQASAAITGNANPAGAMLPSPQSPAQMGAMALFVIAALKSGDLSQILNERAHSILKAAGKSGLISSLSQEGQAISRSENAAQDWRALTLPMLWENEVNKVILHYKNDGGGEENSAEEKGKQTRFIFDLNLSRMGKVQLDGLFRDKRMDMVLRTQEPFSRPMQLHIQNGYHNAMEVTGLVGDISFQNDPQSWVNIKSAQNGQFKANI